MSSLFDLFWGQLHIPKPGHEVVCEVSQVGANIKDFKKGDLLGFGTQRDSCDKCKWCLNGQEEVCTQIQARGTY